MSGSSALLAARLRTQRLIGTPFPTAASAVGFLVCVQSQDPLGAKWSLGMRVKGATEASLDRAFNEGKFLRTHILRPTWHYVLPADISWILDLTAPHILRGNGAVARKLELDAKVMTKAKRLMEKALADGNHLTRNQLSDALARGKVVAEGQRMAYVMMEAELTGLVCSGAMQGKQHTYALLEERVGESTRVGGGKRVREGKKGDREEGVAELLRRFVVGHAPTTIRQFCWWSGLGLTEARKARAALGKTLTGQIVDEVEWLGGTGPTTHDSRPTTLLVPEYDEVLVGTADIGIPRLMADRRIKGRTTNTFDRPLLVGGRWAGTWRRIITPKQVVIEVERFGKLGRAGEMALKREVERYAKFVGRSTFLR